MSSSHASEPALTQQHSVILGHVLSSIDDFLQPASFAKTPARAQGTPKRPAQLLVGPAWEEIARRRGGRSAIQGIKPLKAACVREKALLDSPNPPRGSNAPHLISHWAAVLECASNYAPLTSIGATVAAPIAQLGPGGTSIASSSSSSAAVAGGQPSSSEKASVKIDVVCSHGARWVRIVGLRASSLLSEWRVSEADTELSAAETVELLEQRQLDEAASTCSVYRTALDLVRARDAQVQQRPEVVMRFTRLAIDNLAEDDEFKALHFSDEAEQRRFKLRLQVLLSSIESLGVQVERPNQLSTLGSDNCFVVPSAPEPASHTAHFNADLSVLVAFVSDICHMPVLTSQAAREATFRVNDAGEAATHGRALSEQLSRDVTAPLFEELRGTTGIVTTRATQRKFFDILQRVGGPDEQRRAQALFSGDAQSFWLGSRWSAEQGAQLLPLPVGLLDEDAASPPPYTSTALEALEQVELGTGAPTTHTLDSLKAGMRNGLTTLTANVASATWLAERIAIEGQGSALMYVVHPRSLAETMREDKATLRKDGGDLMLDSIDAPSSTTATPWTQDTHVFKGSLSETKEGSFLASSSSPRVQSAQLDAPRSRSAPARALRWAASWIEGSRPRERLVIRHYPWWPFAKPELAWLKLTSPIAWRDPALHSAQQSRSPLPTSHDGNAWRYESDEEDGRDKQDQWAKGVKADWRLNWKHWLLLAVVYVAWVLGFAYFVKSLWYESSIKLADGSTLEPDFVGCTTTFWVRNAGCGLNGDQCSPFTSNTSVAFRCPSGCASTKLGERRAVGGLVPAFVPLVVGGQDRADGKRIYRGDSWICAAAQHAGVIDAAKGGCGALWLSGTNTDYQDVSRNGIESIAFNSTFPSSYYFEQTNEAATSGCEDTRERGYALNVVLLAFVGFVLRPKRIVWFFTLVCVGFWHINMLSEPRTYPPEVGGPAGDFLPALFGAYVIWRVAVRFVWPAAAHIPIEREIWTMGLFWIGVMLNLVFENVPLQRLVASDIASQPGSLTALIVIIVVVLVLVVNQVRVIRKVGALPKYLSLAIVGGVMVALLAAIPTTGLRLHHYIIALVLISFVAFPTRLGLIYCGFLLGMYLNGVARWGFDGIIQDVATIRGDAVAGTGIPTFFPASEWQGVSPQSPTGDGLVRWGELPSDQPGAWDGFALLVDDVLRYSGSATSFNLSTLASAYLEDAGLGAANFSLYPGGQAALQANIQTQPHWLRLAYSLQGVPGDFTRAAAVYYNSTFIEAPSGRT